MRLPAGRQASTGMKPSPGVPTQSRDGGILASSSGVAKEWPNGHGAGISDAEGRKRYHGRKPVELHKHGYIYKPGRARKIKERA